MAARELTVTLRRRDGVTILDLAGDIGRDADDTLRDAYDRAATEGSRRMLLNFSQVGDIDSTGIAVIVGLLARARADRRQVRAYGLSEHYQTIFTITRLSDFIQISTDEDSAVNAPPAPGGTEASERRGGTE